MLRDLLIRLGILETTTARPRRGVVSATAPLAVKLGGSTVAYTAVKRIDGPALVVGDPVMVAMWGNDLIVLGKIV